jgi:UDP-N-acetylglucosamine/UDP-N-acetylgalactosamine diphosphorylase
MTSEQLKILTNKGVIIKHPESIFIDDDVILDNICSGAEIYPGCRIFGSTTYIGKGAKLGNEAPVTVKNSQLGDGATIAGGFIDNTTLLEGANAGDGFHSRPGTLLEEYAAVGHTVGLKQTILFPFVTTGSLINFCDILCLVEQAKAIILRLDHLIFISILLHTKIKQQLLLLVML